jgi:hypothetical protein
MPGVLEGAGRVAVAARVAPLLDASPERAEVDHDADPGPGAISRRRGVGRHEAGPRHDEDDEQATHACAHQRTTRTTARPCRIVGNSPRATILTLPSL